MQITIDTKSDSHDDIRKVISLLSRMIDEEKPARAADIFGNNTGSSSSSESSPVNAFASIFGEESKTNNPVQPAEEENKIINLNDPSDEESDDIPEVIPY